MILGMEGANIPMTRGCRGGVSCGKVSNDSPESYVRHPHLAQAPRPG